MPKQESNKRKSATEDAGKRSRVSSERRGGRWWWLPPFGSPIVGPQPFPSYQHHPFQHRYGYRSYYAPPLPRRSTAPAMAPFDFHPDSFHIPPNESFDDVVVDGKQTESPSLHQHHTHHYHHEYYYPYDPNYPHYEDSRYPNHHSSGSAPEDDAGRTYPPNKVPEDVVGDEEDIVSSASTPLRSNQSTKEQKVQSSEARKGPYGWVANQEQRDAYHGDMKDRYGYNPGYDYHRRYNEDPRARAYYHQQQQQDHSFRGDSNKTYSHAHTEASYYHDHSHYQNYYDPYDWRYGEDSGHYSYPALAPAASEDQDNVIPVPPTPAAQKAPPKVTPPSQAAIRKKVSEDADDSVLQPSSPNATEESKSASQFVPSLASIKEQYSSLVSESTNRADPSQINFVHLQDYDIVVGRGAPTAYHIGNEYFRELVSEHAYTYFCSKRSDKPLIAMKVLDILKERGSRFVKRQKGGTKIGASWVVVNDKLAYEKVCAALREGAPEVQQRLMSSSQKIRESVAQDRKQKENGRN